MRESIHGTFGRQAFGVDPGGYHAARPTYPDWVFDVLCKRCGLPTRNMVTSLYVIDVGLNPSQRELRQIVNLSQ